MGAGRTSLREPLEALGDDLSRFVRKGDVRLMCVEADSRLRSGAERIVRAIEHHADNLSPAIVLQVGGDADDDAAWDEATGRLREAHAKAREAGSPFAALDERPLAGAGAASFAAQLLQCRGTVQAPGEGLMIVLLPKAQQLAEAWRRRLGELVGRAQLEEVRFVLLAYASPAIEEWLTTFEPGTFMHRVCVVDEDAATAELDQEVRAEAEGGPECRGAWPRGVHPPARPGAADGTRPPGPDKAVAHQTRLHVKGAAVALRRGDGPEAIREQVAARDLCLTSGKVRDAVAMELVLGSYLDQLGQRPLAVSTFEGAAERAAAADHWDLAAQARCAAASTHDAAGNSAKALGAYREAIDAALRGGVVVLAFEAWWQAGQIALRTGIELDAIALWADAVAHATTLEASATTGTRAKAIADELTRLLAKHRRYSDARRIERLAAGF